MKKTSLFILLAFGLIAPAQSQEGGGRILEMLVRGIAHAVASENGSHIVPPQVQSTPSRSWYQQPQPRPQPRVVVPTPQPRVVRQPSQPVQPYNPFGGLYQAPVQQYQAVPQRPVVHPRQVVTPSPRPNPVPWFSSPSSQGHDDHGHHGHHDDHGHGSYHQPQPQPQRNTGFFGSRQPTPPQHSGHDHRSHQQAQPQPQQRVIAIRSQFQPFTIFQGQQNATTVSRGQVRQVPNQGSIVWLRR